MLCLASLSQSLPKCSFGLTLALVVALARPPALATLPPADPALEQALLTQLEPYLAPGADLSITYESLRQRPTQVGVAVPKYYVWVNLPTATPPLSGAARIAAYEGTYTVTHFVSSTEIQADPEQLSLIFPAVLIPDILERAQASPRTD